MEAKVMYLFLNMLVLSVFSTDDLLSNVCFHRV